MMKKIALISIVLNGMVLSIYNLYNNVFQVSNAYVEIENTINNTLENRFKDIESSLDNLYDSPCNRFREISYVVDYIDCNNNRRRCFIVS